MDQDTSRHADEAAPTQIRTSGARQAAILVSVGALGHAFCLVVFGATFWYDSIVYVELARALDTANGLQEFYAGPRGILFQHISPGVSMLWAVLHKLLGTQLWVPFACVQHALALIANVYFVRSFHKELSFPTQIACVALISIYPGYVSFHNAPLTESVSGSLLLLIAGAALRALSDVSLPFWRAALLILSGFLVTQWRAYLGIVAILYSFLLWRVLRTKGDRMKLAGIVSAVTAGVLAFPMLRSMAVNEFFLPNVDYISLAHALYVNDNPSDFTRHEITRLYQRAGLELEGGAKSAATYQSAVSLAEGLAKNGISSNDAKKAVKEVAWRVRTEDLAVLRRQVQLNLASIGLAYVSVCCNWKHAVRSGYSATDYYRHHRYYWNWHARTLDRNYKSEFASFRRRYAEAGYYTLEAISQYSQAIEPYIRASTRSWTDPGRLMSIPTDVWVGLGMFGVVLLRRKSKRIQWIVIIPLGVIYLVTLLAAVVGGMRYSHSLYPFYFVCMGGLCEMTLRSCIRSWVARRGVRGGAGVSDRKV